jgi:hypothetical protein
MRQRVVVMIPSIMLTDGAQVLQQAASGRGQGHHLPAHHDAQREEELLLVRAIRESQDETVPCRIGPGSPRCL